MDGWCGYWRHGAAVSGFYLYVRHAQMPAKIRALMDFLIERREQLRWNPQAIPAKSKRQKGRRCKTEVMSSWASVPATNTISSVGVTAYRNRKIASRLA